MQKKLIVLLLLPLIAFGICTQVFAAQSVDPDKQCSVTFLMEFEGEPLEGGSLTIYRVGQISYSGDSFVPVDALLQDNPDFSDLQDKELAETLSELAVERKLPSYKASVVDGKAVFSDLKTGVYVVSQKNGEEIKGYSAINPFLISLPQWYNDTYVYNLIAAPKVELVPSSTQPPEPTQPGDTPDIPQTGQLNWPVPILAVAGLALFLVGWKLFFSSSRRKV